MVAAIKHLINLVSVRMTWFDPVKFINYSMCVTTDFQSQSLYLINSTAMTTKAATFFDLVISIYLIFKCRNIFLKQLEKNVNSLSFRNNF